MVQLLIQSKDKHMYIRIVLNKEWYIIFNTILDCNTYN